MNFHKSATTNVKGVERGRVSRPPLGCTIYMCMDKHSRRSSEWDKHELSKAIAFNDTCSKAIPLRLLGLLAVLASFRVEVLVVLNDLAHSRLSNVLHLGALEDRAVKVGVWALMCAASNATSSVSIVR